MRESQADEMPGSGDAVAPLPRPLRPRVEAHDGTRAGVGVAAVEVSVADS